MLRIGFDTLLTVHTFVLLGVLALLWARQSWKQSRDRWATFRDILVHCRQCEYLYVARALRSNARCPHCGALNRVSPRGS